jgi:prevent-host-death family protein
MPQTVISSREFNQDVGRAKKATAAGPVVITDRGRPAHVLLSIEDYRRLTNGKQSLGEALAEEEATDFDFEAPKAALKLKVPDFP